MQFETLAVAINAGVATVDINRPHKANAMTLQAWRDLGSAFRQLDELPEVRVVVLRGAGNSFCAGIDLELLGGIQDTFANDDCAARPREWLQRWIMQIQDDVTAIERCRKPVLAAIHGHCIGGGIDIAVACDMRYCSDDANFCVKEVDMAVVADVGVLQRLPHIIGEGRARELAFTGRRFNGREAAALGLVNTSYATAEVLFAAVDVIARDIAGKSPLAVRGTKSAMNYARDHSIADGLHQVATWNAAALQSDDFREVMQALKEKRAPRFRD